jgi:L-malate glycosyltransferase
MFYHDQLFCVDILKGKDANLGNNRTICYLANAASVHTVRWLNYFADKDWSIHLITWHKPSAENPVLNSKITVHKIIFAPHYAALYLALPEILFLIAKIRPDILHGHYLSHFGMLAGLFGRLTGFKPIIVSAWGSDILIGANGFKKFLIKQVLKTADCVHCDGSNVERILLEWGVEKKKLNLIRFGVDTLLFSPTIKSQNSTDSLCTISSPFVISTRSLNLLYDVETFIKAIPIVRRVFPEIKYVIIGQGSEQKNLVKLVHLLGISECTRFLGFIPNYQIPDFLTLSDIYVSTSTSDSGLASSTAEAMSCGVPVIISDVGDNSEWVNEGKNGLIFPVGDSEALASKIIYLLSNSQLKKNIGIAGRQTILNKFSWEKEMAKVDTIYSELIERYGK